VDCFEYVSEQKIWGITVFRLNFDNNVKNDEFFIISQGELQHCGIVIVILGTLD
jgi:hypothetical protein